MRNPRKLPLPRRRSREASLHMSSKARWPHVADTVFDIAQGLLLTEWGFWALLLNRIGALGCFLNRIRACGSTFEQNKGFWGVSLDGLHGDCSGCPC